MTKPPCTPEELRAQARRLFIGLPPAFNINSLDPLDPYGQPESGSDYDAKRVARGEDAS